MPVRRVPVKSFRFSHTTDSRCAWSVGMTSLMAFAAVLKEVILASDFENDLAYWLDDKVNGIDDLEEVDDRIVDQDNRYGGIGDELDKTVAQTDEIDGVVDKLDDSVTRVLQQSSQNDSKVGELVRAYNC